MEFPDSWSVRERMLDNADLYARHCVTPSAQVAVTHVRRIFVPPSDRILRATIRWVRSGGRMNVRYAL